ncbi:hypothetical protein GYMLUDRAFT_341890 [Collybiopsis luxurians FD-317 M1]|nr:hypothetical protein GYMLUDRAFT_341890 [Collybiopsis luxurians FD-317 M1]
MASITSNLAPAAIAAPPPQAVDPATEELTRLLQEAVKKFKDGRGVKIPEWDAILQDMNGCDSVGKICDILDKHLPEKFQATRDGNSKWKALRENCLKPAVAFFLPFSDALAELAGHFPIVPGGKTIFVAFSVLLRATQGVSGWFDSLNDFFKDLQNFLEPVSMVLPFRAKMGTAFYKIVLAIFAHTIEVAYAAMKMIGKGSGKGRIKLFIEALKGSNKLQIDNDRLHGLMQQVRDLVNAAMAKEIFGAHATSI